MCLYLITIPLEDTQFLIYAITDELDLLLNTNLPLLDINNLSSELCLNMELVSSSSIYTKPNKIHYPIRTYTMIIVQSKTLSI
jgi:hypothetical protein